MEPVENMYGYIKHTEQEDAYNVDYLLVCVQCYCCCYNTAITETKDGVLVPGMYKLCEEKKRIYLEAIM